jgi:hypothetical protein
MASGRRIALSGRGEAEFAQNRSDPLVLLADELAELLEGQVTARTRSCPLAIWSRLGEGDKVGRSQRTKHYQVSCLLRPAVGARPGSGWIV